MAAGGAGAHELGVVPPSKEMQGLTIDRTPHASPGRDIARTMLISLAAVGTAAKPLTVTEHEFGDETAIAHIASPCIGVPRTLTEVVNGVVNVTGSGLGPAEPDGAAGETPILRYVSRSHDTEQERT